MKFHCIEDPIRKLQNKLIHKSCLTGLQIIHALLITLGAALIEATLIAHAPTGVCANMQPLPIMGCRV